MFGAFHALHEAMVPDGWDLTCRVTKGEGARALSTGRWAVVELSDRLGRSARATLPLTTITAEMAQPLVDELYANATTP